MNMEPNRIIDIDAVNSVDLQSQVRVHNNLGSVESPGKKKKKRVVKRGPLHVTNPDLDLMNSDTLKEELSQPDQEDSPSLGPLITIRTATPQSPANASISKSSHSLSPSTFSLSPQPYAATSKPVIRSNSAKSVESMVAAGHFGIGSLRLHEDLLEEEKENNILRDPQKAEQQEIHRITEEGNFLRSGDALILSDFPKDFFLALDAGAFLSSDISTLTGVSGIPPGVHLLYGGLGTDVMRSGIWMICGAKYKTSGIGEVVVRKWSAYDELIVEEVSKAETMIQGDELSKDKDRQKKMIAYSLSVPGGYITFAGSVEDTPLHNIWYRVSNSITGYTLNRITGDDWNCWKVNSADGFHCDPLKGIGDSLQKVKTYFFIFERDHQTYTMDVTGPERTRDALDSSEYIRNLIKTKCPRQNWNEIIGDLQFAYLTGMLIGNFRCMEQWALMMKVIFKAYKLAVDEPVFFTKIIEAVRAQLTYDVDRLEGSIFDHDAMLKAEMKVCLIIFKKELNENLLERAKRPHGLSSEQVVLGKVFQAFENYLWTSKWMWDLRGKYVRSGKAYLEDGEQIEYSASELEAFDGRDSDSETFKEKGWCRSKIPKQAKKAGSFFKKAFSSSPP